MKQRARPHMALWKFDLLNCYRYDALYSTESGPKSICKSGFRGHLRCSIQLNHYVDIVVSRQVLSCNAHIRIKGDREFKLPLGYYAESSGNSLPTFRDNLPLPSSRDDCNNCAFALVF